MRGKTGERGRQTVVTMKIMLGFIVDLVRNIRDYYYTYCSVRNTTWSVVVWLSVLGILLHGLWYFGS